MGIMTNRNACRGGLILVLAVLAIPSGLQLGLAQDREWIGATIEEIHKAAEEGDASAQYEFGWKYDLGLGVPKDTERAVNWYRMAAEQGHASAQRTLGFKYALGEGVWKDEREAVKWWRKAAEQGDRHAQLMLGRVYHAGVGVSHNYREAVRWFRKAAEQGDVGAQFNLGLMYTNGEGVPQNYREAVKWYRLAAEQGHVGAQRNLGALLALECFREIQDANRQLREQAIEALIEAMRTGRIPNLSARKKCDLVEAYAWLLVAKAQGVELPDEVREPFQRFMTRREVEQAQELAAEIFNRIESSKSE